MRLLPLTAVAVCAAVVLAVPGSAGADEIRDAQWHLPWLDLPAAHDISTGEGTSIGIIDSGVLAEHPDLSGAVQPGLALSGSIDPLADPTGTGTAVASIAVGRGVGTAGSTGVSGGDGILGVAPAAQVVSVSIGDPEIGDGAYVAEAVDELVRIGVDVILLSIQHPSNTATGHSVTAALDADIPVVTVGGDGGVSYPDAVHAVAVDRDGQLIGPGAEQETGLTVAAPGEDIPVATPDGGYTTSVGGALAAAIVAGTMALVKAHQPGLGGRALIQHVLSHGVSGPTDEAAGSMGAGVIDPLAALTGGGNDVPDSSQEATAEDTPAEVVATDNTLLVTSIAVGGLLVQVALLAYARLVGRKHPA